MVRKLEGLEELDFDIEAYRKRLQLLRQIVSGENQQDFAARIGIDAKRWNNYEQGYPMPRHVGMMLMTKLDGMSIDWIWYGKTGNLSGKYLEAIRAAEALEIAQAKARLQLVHPQPQAKPAKKTAKKARARKRS
ncbi:hypothetical protein JQ581_30130 [Bradyrhizobium liaoningense]|uniref:hypothetical protein n=1 Tax=Bradyrhizobium liaoningense TaxID=43992 RepID=UPI001BA96FAF|nr:hypothetical protein [Bradyrhizobium liaoningense]MBR0741199.1 hypothetical protein [Bradyrhizobium liaoningense]